MRVRSTVVAATVRYPRTWGFASNQLLVKRPYAFRYSRQKHSGNQISL
jgi:hypothetical protein